MHLTCSFGQCSSEAGAGECTTVAQLLAEQQALIPIMEQYHVDVYDAGHVHSYEVLVRAVRVSGPCVC